MISPSAPSLKNVGIRRGIDSTCSGSSFSCTDTPSIKPGCSIGRRRRRDTEICKTTYLYSGDMYDLMTINRDEARMITARPSKRSRLYRVQRSVDDRNNTVKTKRKNYWLIYFRRLDPPYQILKFFNDTASIHCIMDNLEMIISLIHITQNDIFRSIETTIVLMAFVLTTMSRRMKKIPVNKNLTRDLSRRKRQSIGKKRSGKSMIGDTRGRFASCPELRQLCSTVPADGDMRRSTSHKSLYKLSRMVKIERQRDWLTSFCRLDPRYQILKFFNDVAREGVNGIEDADFTIKEEAFSSPRLRASPRAAAFSVWRPTSNDAIRKMMVGEGAGKGLEVKGKSAKRGKLSGLIPFLQIHEETHKRRVRWPPKDGMIRIYYKSETSRDRAAVELMSVSGEMTATVSDARVIIAKSCTYNKQHLNALKKLVFDVVDPKVHMIDDYSPLHFGITVAERIFFNAYISKQDISRSFDYDTGRSSEPAFQDMNFACIRKYEEGSPRVVILQTSDTVDADLFPQSLVVAYEEHGSITPVTSDFDCFLVGTRDIHYETSISKDQVEVLKWLLTQIEVVLDSPTTSKSWTSRWLEVLKESEEKGFYPEMPEFGFGDPKSYAIIKAAVARLSVNGAVRHGAECFNYIFPQELDEHFLVISDHLDSNIPWSYVNVQELQDILCNRIDNGFIFPLNPKWILADHGWKAVYNKMISSDDESAQKSLAVWYPPESGIRELIEDIHIRFPNGFQSLNVRSGNRCANKGHRGNVSGRATIETPLNITKS